MIVSAQSYHIKDIVKLCQKYYEESPYRLTHEFDPDTTLEYTRRAIIYPHCEVAVAEWQDTVAGFSLCYVSEYPWCIGLRSHMEFLYVLPEFRQYGLAEALIEHQEAWSRRMKALELIGGDLGLRPALLQRFLESQGFQDPGLVIRKVLTNEA